MTFTQMPWEMYASGPLAAYRKAFREHQRREAPWPLTGDLMFCDASAERAEAMAREYMAELLPLDREPLRADERALQGDEGLRALRERGGRPPRGRPGDRPRTPTSASRPGARRGQILEKLDARKRLLGGFETLVIARYGGMQVEDAEESLRLFAEQVLPEVHAW